MVEIFKIMCLLENLIWDDKMRSWIMFNNLFGCSECLGMQGKFECSACPELMLFILFISHTLRST